MNATDPVDGSDRPDRDASSHEARARRDRRAEALRANLKRRKAQSRGRACAERGGPAD